ncbi:MAG: endonuclease domain-containing protein [Verrucomicrobium sp.]
MGGTDPIFALPWALLKGVLEKRTLHSDVIRYLARKRHEAVWKVQEALAGKLGYELELRLDRLLQISATDEMKGLCRLIFTAGQAGAMARWKNESRQDMLMKLAALQDLCAVHDATPTLLVTMLDDTPPPYVECCVETLVNLAGEAPSMLSAMTLSEATLNRYLKATRESRAKSMLLEGLVHIEGSRLGSNLEGPAPALQPPSPSSLSSEDQVDRALRFLDIEVPSVARDQMERLRLEGKEAVRPAKDPEGADRARSAAERFLYQVLEACPLTKGLFELNGELDIRFGPRRLEVDLLARAQSIAVEIDGYYHFQDVTHYRRDRRKDLALQESGYLVLRFLADDVVSQIETVLATIYNSVICKRKEQTQVSTNEIGE